MKLTVVPLTAECWPDLEALFAGKGCSFARACWCMECRYDGTRADLGKGAARAEANRRGMKSLVDEGRVPGLIGYHGKTPVGWISLAPREEFGRLKRSSAMRAVDNQPVWSVVCFVVPSEYRGQGVAQGLLKAAVTHAKMHGAKIVEGYPIDKPERSNDGFMWVGAKSMYDKAGFQEVARHKPQRPIMRVKAK